MSRCFPFPPPGYERKARYDDKDLLEKEKNRDKKQKKEKEKEKEKDKEKRESKDKRDKDRSDGKHREKKDRKEKHRDKAKDKDTERDKDRDKAKDKDSERDKDRDKAREKKREKEDTEKARDKSKAPDEKRLSGQPGPQGGEKLDPKESKEKNNSVDKKFSGQVGGHKVEKLSHNINPVEESKFVKDLGRRIKDDATATGNDLANFPSLDRKKDEGIHRMVAKGTSAVGPIKEKDKRAEAKPSDVHGPRDGTRPGGNAFVQNIVGTAPNKFEVLPRLLDKSAERKLEGNEKPKDKEIGGKGEAKLQEKDKEGEDKRAVVKTQEKDGKEKKSHGKDNDRDREKKKEDREKRKEDKQKKKEEKQRKKEDKEKKKKKEEKATTNDLVDNHGIKPPQPPKQSDSTIAPSDPNPKKRKDLETNGVAHAHDYLPNKLLRPTPSSHPLPLENGRVSDHSQTSVLATERKKVAAFDEMKVDGKEPKINGITEAQPSSSVSPMKVKPATPAADQMAKPPARPPHPDTKYLSQIYSVPKSEEWSDHGGQEWLFSEPKKPRVDPSGPEETPPLVWAEARRIESADIFALPYVIPY